MTYDVVMFSHELLLLEARLHILYDVVDKFLILESQFTHTNLPKPLNFLDNYSRFEKFKDKIIYITTKEQNNHPIYSDWLARDILQREFKNFQWNDIIFHGDLDEIVKPELLKETIQNLSTPISFRLDAMCWTVDISCEHLWHGPILLKNGWIKDSLYKYRENRNNTHFNYYKVIENAGKHYSYLAPIDNILKKFDSYAHSAEVDKSIKTRENILKCIKNRTGFDGKPTFPKIEINEQNIPKHILDNKDKYKEFFSSYYDDVLV